MGIPLIRSALGQTTWFNDMDGNLATLEESFVARQNSDTSSVTVTGTTAETALMASTTIPANALAVGTVLRPWAAGSLTVAASTTPTITFRLRWGGLGGVELWTVSWSMGSSGSPYTNSWVKDLSVVCASVGGSGSVETDGWTGNGSGFFVSAPALATIDTTTSKVLLWTVQLSLSSASVTQRMMVVNKG